MTKIWRLAFAAIIAAVMTTPTLADEASRNARDREIQELRARLDRLEREAEDERIVAGSRLNKVEETQNAVQWSFADGRPSVRSGDGRFEMALRGRFQFDTALYEQDASNFGAAVPPAQLDLGSGAIFRRVRFGVEGRFFRDFIYEMRFDFGGSDVEGAGAINIMRIGYVGIPHLLVHAGALKPVFTLYDSTSSADLVAIERPAVVTTIVSVFGGDNARRGVEAMFQHENLLWDGDNVLVTAAFTGNRTTGLGGCENPGHSSGTAPATVDDECTQLLGRAAFRLWSDGVSNLQIGGSAAQILSLQGTNPGGPRNIRFRERPENRVSGERFVDTGNMASEDASLYGIELGANFENFYIAAEYYRWEVDRVGTILDPEFSGWYVEGEWIFTGENKRYQAAATSNNIAVFRSPTVSSPWSLGGGDGAWSATARYSVIDLNFREDMVAADGGVAGGEQAITNIGLNWYMNTNLKMQFEYALVDVARDSAPGMLDGGLDAEFDIYQSRVQFTF